MSIFESTPHERLEERRADIDPAVYEFLQIGERADAYASGQVQHNTLSGNVESVLEHGLIPGHTLSVPDEDDLAFARALMRRSDGYTADKERRFDIYVAGIKDERAPGVFLSVIGPEPERHNSSYGIPERSMILMREMGLVMLASSTFDAETRDQAAAIHEKYRDRLYRTDEHIAVLAVDPLSPSVLRQRLSANLDGGMSEDSLIWMLPRIGRMSFEGLYVPEVIPPRDIRVTGITEPLPEPPEPIDDISRSRFYAPPVR